MNGGKDVCELSHPSFLILLFREPAFANPFPLLEEFKNRPETRETEDAKKYRYIDVLYEQRPDASSDSQDEKNRPALHSEVIFCLDDDRMEDANAKEGP